MGFTIGCLSCQDKDTLPNSPALGCWLGKRVCNLPGACMECCAALPSYSLASGVCMCQGHACSAVLPRPAFTT